MLADGTGANKAKVGVNVDFANCHFCCFAKKFFGNADCVGHLAAEFVNDFYPFLRNGRRTVENDRETGKSFFNFFKNIETKFGFVAGFEFICAVGSSDCDCKGVNSGSFYEFLNLFGSGVGRIFSGNVNVVFDTCKGSEFAFNANAVCMSIFNNLSGKSDVVLEIIFGTVDHNGSETAVDAAFANFEVCAVVKMKSNGKTGVVNSGFNKFGKINGFCIVSCACGNLKNKRSFFFSCCFGDTLDNFHVIYVESADCIAAFISFCEHFFCSYERHKKSFLSKQIFTYSFYTKIDCFSIASGIYLTFIPTNFSGKFRA